MPRRIIEDITPPENRRSIRNIPVPSRPQKQTTPIPPVQQQSVPIQKRAAPTPKYEAPKVSQMPPVQPQTNYVPEREEFYEGKPTPIPVMGTPNENRRWKKKITTFFVVTLFALLGYGVYLFLHIGATIIITPKEKVAAVNGKFTAKKNPQSGELAFEVVTLEEEASKTVPSTGEKTVEKRAVGKVVIYNNFSSATQRLVKNTRLETPDGLIYKIDSSVVVPGTTKNSSGAVVPGSIEVSVTADSPGEKYNITLTDFSIPGFKDDKPRFDGFYARSKTEMTGGFEGKIKVASEKDRGAAVNDLTNSLKESLLKKAKSEVPQNFILFDTAAYVTIQDLSVAESTEVKIKATLHGIMFNKESLSTSIAESAIPEYYESTEKVLAANIEKLTFAPDSLEVSPWDTGNMPFTLSGTTTIVWQVDEEKLKSDLAGVPKTKVDEIYPLHHGIEVAELKLEPPWKGSLPEDPERIKIEILPPKNP